MRRRSRNLAAGVTAMTALVGVSTGANAAHDHGGDPAAVADSVLAGATLRLEVEGMACPICARALEKRLATLEVVEAVVVRLDEGEVLLRESKELRVGEAFLRRQIEDVGFVLEGFSRVMGGGT